MSISIKEILNPDFIGEAYIRGVQSKTPTTLDGLRAAFKRVANIIKPPKSVSVHYLSDNGGYPDTAKIEIRKRLSDINAHLSSATGQSAPETHYHDIPAQDWRAGAFDIAQLTRDTVRGVGNVIFLNCAPRRKERGIKTDNEGEGVFIGMHKNGTIVSAVSEDSFALFRDLIERGEFDVYRANVQTKGSQFRSRDFFPWLSQVIAFNLQNKTGKWKSGLNVEERRAFLDGLEFIDTSAPLTLDRIYNFDENPAVLRVDCHGNLKLSVRESDFDNIPLNVPFQISINNQALTVVRKVGMFDPNPHTNFGLAAGSSGDWPDSSQGRFMEIALLGNNTRAALKLSDQDLKEGVHVEITPPQTPVLVASSQKGIERHA